MPINDKVTYNYKDLGILSAEISYVKSRSECNPYYTDTADWKQYLPIFASPMTSVVSDTNYEEFTKNHLYAVIPREKDLSIERRIELMKEGKWVAFGLHEFEDVFCGEAWTDTFGIAVYNVCVDLANGEMENLYNICKKAKRVSLDKPYTLNIMTGNINNPKTYDWIRRLNNGFYVKYGKHELVIDYIRLGIGGGEGCFVDGTKVTMSDGNKKNIEDVNVGESVLSHDGTCNEVTSRTRYRSSEPKVIINGEIKCTDSHKFYVVNKDDIASINEENVEEFAFWVEAKNLDKSKHLLIKREMEKDV